jgi:hypothetical protein
MDESKVGRKIIIVQSNEFGVFWGIRSFLIGGKIKSSSLWKREKINPSIDMKT